MVYREAERIHKGQNLLSRVSVNACSGDTSDGLTADRVARRILGNAVGLRKDSRYFPVSVVAYQRTRACTW